MKKNANSVWNECLVFIKDNISPQAFKTWFAPIIPVQLNQNTLIIQVPSKFFYEWLEEHYIKLLRVALTKSLGEEAKLVYDVKMESYYNDQEPFTFEKLLELENKIKNTFIDAKDTYSKLLEYDVFISHSSEDKNDFVRPLANELKKIGVKVWYDEFELKIGDSLRKSIDKGLINSKYGIVILSTSFFNRNWTQYELNGFINREMSGSNIILPIWHKVSKDEVQNFSPSLADKVALNSSIHSIKEIAREIQKII